VPVALALSLPPQFCPFLSRIFFILAVFLCSTPLTKHKALAGFQRERRSVKRQALAMIVEAIRTRDEERESNTAKYNKRKTVENPEKT